MVRVMVMVRVMGKVMVRVKVRVRVKVMVRVKVKVMVKVKVRIKVKVMVEVRVRVKVIMSKYTIEGDIMKKRTIEVSEETYAKIKEQVDNDKLNEINDFDDFIGESFFFRTVTYHLIGMVDKRLEGTNILKLSDASWVADSGRFMDAIKHGILDEVEPVGAAFINMDTVTDFFPWNHKLPSEQK